MGTCLQQGKVWMGDVKMLDRDRRVRDIFLRAYAVKDAEGTVTALVGVHTDVTEKLRLEEMMIQSEKMLSVGGLAAGMAHEINNPLAGMMQSANVITGRLSGDMEHNRTAAAQAGTSMDAIREYMALRDIPRLLEMIKDSGAHAAEIVTNMLSFARKSDANFVSSDLAALINQTVDLAASDYNLKKKYDFRAIEIIREFQAGMPKVTCEPSKIRQVILNILRNGAEAMQTTPARDSGSEQPKFVLRLRYEKDHDMARIEISDNGPGMDSETCKRAFEPFFTTKSVDTGTGLGLSVSYFIVKENHRGELHVESTPGKGTTFIIRLPVTHDPTLDRQVLSTVPPLRP